MGKGARTAWLRVYRAAVFVGVVLMIHRGTPPVDPESLVAAEEEHEEQSGPADLQSVERHLDAKIEDLHEFFPSAVGISNRGVNGTHYVLDSAHNELGFVATTSPESDSIIGYSGPNNVLLAFGADGKLLGMSVLKSGDTPEHVEQVLEDDSFMATFDGKTWDEIKEMRSVDAVSGATLTSLAIAEGVIGKLSGSAPSLRFPQPLELAAL